MALTLLGAAFAGCISNERSLATTTCPVYLSEDRQAVYRQIDRKFASEGNGSLFGVMALRHVEPDRLQNDTSTGGPQEDPVSYIIWAEVPPQHRPPIVHELICLSEWRIEQGVTAQPFWTEVFTTPANASDAMKDLAQVHADQNGQRPDWCCFILHDDQFYGVKDKGTSWSSSSN